MRALVIAAALVAAAASAHAQPAAENTRAACTDRVDNDGDGHVDCDDQDCQDFTFCAAAAMPRSAAPVDDVARLRGRGTMRVVLGAVLLGLGIVAAGVSAVPWVAISGHSFDPASGPAAAAIALDVVGVSMIGAGTALLAIGAGNLAETRRPRVAFSATSFGVRF